MVEIVDTILRNLLSPAVLFFALGLGAGLARSDLSIPEALAKGLALYLMLAIGFKGGVAVRGHGFDTTLLATLATAALLSFAMPIIAYALLRATSGVSRTDAGAIAAHYGSISLVTFVTALKFLEELGLDSEGFMVAAAAVMETPAIVAGLWLARRSISGEADKRHGLTGDLVREICLNGSVVILLGAFAIGLLTGDRGQEALGPFIGPPFQGILALFLLDLGLLVARRLSAGTRLSVGLIAFAFYMPILGAGIGLAAGWSLGLSVGGTALFAVLCASASYIAVPAALRLALPQANPALSLTMSLALTFPFNVALGIPLYTEAARLLVGG
jgi:hypothetical protein